MFKQWMAWVSAHERMVSAFAMVAGFVVDQIFFGPIDLWLTQLVFISYIVICVVAIGGLHWLEARGKSPRWRSVLPIATQFSLGGFWSGFVVFYGRSASLAVSWPFLALLIAIVILNEVYKEYHERLVFTSVLFFFALYSFAILEVPIIVGAIGTWVFILSGAVAIGTFALFTMLLRFLGRARFNENVWQIRAGALVVLVIVNAFYFTSILPPIPLSLRAVGIYHSVSHVGSAYTAQAEHEPVLVRLGLKDPTLHAVAGDSLYGYSAIFTPVSLATTVRHRWQYYDVLTRQWITDAQVAYPISGGRDGGYRGYSVVNNLRAGQWRLDILSADGRLIGRENFTIQMVGSEPALSAQALE